MPPDAPRPRYQEKIRRHGPAVLLLFLAATLLTLNVDTPFRATHEANGRVFMGAAAFHVRMGLAYTKGQDVFVIGANGKSAFDDLDPRLIDRYFGDELLTPDPYGHHPPLLGLTIAAFVKIFGASYASVRAVPILYSLLALLVFYSLMLRLFGLGIARLATLFFTTFPIYAYYGRNVCHEAPVLFWGLMLVLAYVAWRRDHDGKSKPWAAVMIVSIVIGGGYGWPMFYLAMLLIVADWLAHRRFSLKLALLSGGTAVLTLLAVLAQLLWFLGGNLERLMEVGKVRTAQGEEGTTARLWLERMIDEYGPLNFGNFSLVLLPFAMAFLLLMIRREAFSLRVAMVLLFGAWGTAHMLLFRNGAWIHEYWMFYLIPFVAAILAWSAVEVFGKVFGPGNIKAAILFGLTAIFLLHLNLDRLETLFVSIPFGEQDLVPWWQAIL